LYNKIKNNEEFKQISQGIEGPPDTSFGKEKEEKGEEEKTMGRIRGEKSLVYCNDGDIRRERGKRRGRKMKRRGEDTRGKEFGVLCWGHPQGKRERGRMENRISRAMGLSSDVNETLRSETETFGFQYKRRPKCPHFHETKNSFSRPRPCKSE